MRWNYQAKQCTGCFKKFCYVCAVVNLIFEPDVIRCPHCGTDYTTDMFAALPLLGFNSCDPEIRGDYDKA